MDGREIRDLLAHVRAHGHEYFTDLDNRPVRVEVVGTAERPHSRIYWLELSAGDTRRTVLVKVTPRLSEFGGDRSEAFDRPRLGVVMDRRPEFEYLGLVKVHEYFAELNDDRFGAVRPLDFIDGWRAIVMEVVEHPTLRQLLRRVTRLTPAFARVDLAREFRHAGAWIRTFHGLPEVEALPKVRARPSELAEAFDVFTSYLGERVRDASFVCAAAETAASAIPNAFGDSFPLGVAHGDFAPRNIFVGPNGQVSVIDMLGRLRVPIYEDIAYFSVNLRTTRLHLVTRGLAFDANDLSRYEDEFLLGYFGREEPPSRRAMAIYELLVLFDKWSSFVARRGGGTRARRLVKTARDSLANRHFVAEAQRLVRAIEAGP